MTGACVQGRREMEKEKEKKEGADDDERGLPGCDYGERRASGGEEGPLLRLGPRARRSTTGATTTTIYFRDGAPGRRLLDVPMR